MAAELLAALLLPCRFHAHGESRLPRGVQFGQDLGAVPQRWADEADDGTQDAPDAARRPFAWSASGCLCSR